MKTKDQPTLYIQEVYINKTENHYISEPAPPYEPFTQDTGRLFRFLQREYGRCASKVYIDKTDGGTEEVGWVFEKRFKYADCEEYYMGETWVTFYTRNDNGKFQTHPLKGKV